MERRLATARQTIKGGRYIFADGTGSPFRREANIRKRRAARHTAQLHAPSKAKGSIASCFWGAISCGRRLRTLWRACARRAAVGGIILGQLGARRSTVSRAHGRGIFPTFGGQRQGPGTTGNDLVACRMSGFLSAAVEKTFH